MKEKPLYYGHRDRIRKKFTLSEPKGLLDYELIELLLTFSIRYKDVKPLAKRLLNKFKSISNILDADADQILEITGIGSCSALLVKLAKELCIKYFEDKMREKEVLSSPENVINFAKARLGGLAYEAFMMIFLNTKNEVIHHEILNVGTIDQITVYPRRIIEKALSFHSAGLIIVHNHPSGHTTPSEDDNRLTKKIKESLLTIDIHLLDHIIVSKEKYYSFNEMGML